MSQFESISVRRALGLAPWMVVIPLLVWFGPIAQDPRYHDFADQRLWLGLPHGQNTWSNLGFMLAGLFGFSRIRALPQHLRASALIMVVGFVAVALGSAWYHLAPSNQTLVWDRLPLAVAFVGAVLLVAADRVHKRAASLLWPGLLLAAGSVAWWAFSGDLRLYVLIQFGGLLAILQCLGLGRRGTLQSAPLWLALACYVVAKVFEMADAWIWQWSSEWFAGHALKHLAAAVGAACLVLALPRASVQV